jgi:acyl-CoA thioester hydrolase
MKDEPVPGRDAYRHFLPIQTRWMDNDVYGHVNNVVYYAYFDTIINRWLIAEGGLDIHAGDTVGLCVESACRFVAPASYPDELEAGLAVERLGNTSVTYTIGIFAKGGATPGTCRAFGRFVHVFVDRTSRKPKAPHPGSPLRAALERLSRKSTAVGGSATE